MTRSLVTGGAGFIGSHLVDRLLLEGHRVRVLDNLSTSDGANIERSKRKIEFIKADVRDRSAVRDAVKRVDYVFHQAAVPSIPWSVENPDLDHEINASGTLGLLLASRRARVRKLVFASSCSIYGDIPGLPKKETDQVQPKFPYSYSKWAGEHLLQMAADVYGLETVALRYFNCFGPRQYASSQYGAAIPGFINRMLAGKAPIIFGDGKQSRDFMHVGNVVHANLLAAEKKGAVGVFNVGSGKNFSLLQLVAVLNRILGTNIQPEFSAARANDIRHSRASLAKSQRHLGYRPVVSFEEGLADTARWMSGIVRGSKKYLSRF